MTGNERIRKWLCGDMDLQEGRALLAELHPNRRIARNAAHFRPGMVEYELKVLAGIPKKEIFNQNGRSNSELLEKTAKYGQKAYQTATEPPVAGKNQGTEKGTGDAKGRGTEEGPRKGPKGKGKEKEGRAVVPADDHTLLKAKEKISELAVDIGKTHRMLFDTGESNDAKTVKLRAGMLEWLSMAARLKEQLWEAKERYCETGRGGRELLELAGKLDRKQDKEQDETQPPSAMGEGELIRRKENLRKYITKCRNRLEYGTNTAQAEKHPMPPGAERAKTEQRLAAYTKELKAVAAELEKRAKQTKTKNKLK